MRQSRPEVDCRPASHSASAEPKPVSDKFTEDGAPGAVIGSRLPDGTERRGIDVEQVIGIDNSKAMLARARRRLRTLDIHRVVLRHGEFMTPQRGRFDAILLAMVLHHAPSPAAFVAHAAGLLVPGGRLIVVELSRHDQDWARDACGDLWLGFEPDELERWGCQAGLAPAASEYLAQRNGFRIQIQPFDKGVEP